MVYQSETVYSRNLKMVHTKLKRFIKGVVARKRSILVDVYSFTTAATTHQLLVAILVFIVVLLIHVSVSSQE